MKCFYHNDMDGRCAAYWVREYAGGSPEDFIAMDYGMKFPMDIIAPGEPVYIVDYSIEPHEMADLLIITPHVIWIDHHKTAIAKYADFPQGIRGIQFDGIAGCELTWMFVSGRWVEYMDDSPGKNPEVAYAEALFTARDEVPRFTRLIGDRDTWQWNYGDEARYLHAGLLSQDTTPFAKTWDKLAEDIAPFIRDGISISRYQKQQNEYLLEARGFEAEFMGLKAICLNAEYLTNSEVFGERLKDYDLGLCFSFNGKYWTVGLYSANIDVSELATMFTCNGKRGGGHKGAAGFQAWAMNYGHSTSGQLRISFIGE